MRYHLLPALFFLLSFGFSWALDGGAVGKSKKIELPGGESMTFQYCPPGNFMMGSPAEEKGHVENENQVPVRISQGFWLARTEVTQAQWKAVMGSNPSHFKGEKLPVESVSWEDVQKFLTKLNEKGGLPDGWKWALPTEAQWEYACRAGTTTVFHFGNSLSSRQANFNGGYPYGGAPKGPYLDRTMDAGSYAANAWGLHDMHGNVWEWCADWYERKLKGGVDPQGPSTGVLRVFRGGSWSGGAALCRAADRDSIGPGIRNFGLGFRPALVPSK